MVRDKKGRFVKVDMRTGEIPGKPGKCWPAWVRIKQGVWECTECQRGPCLLPLLYVVAFEEAEAKAVIEEQKEKRKNIGG
jgi:hypothetical protein